MSPIEAASAPAVLTIDLGAVAANYLMLRDRAAGALCAGVVKADAYGLGAARVGPALWQAGCRVFFVAHVSEGVALRAALPEAAIYVLNGYDPEAAIPFREAALRPVLNSLGEVDAWAEEARRLGAPLPACLHVDTGMARLGLPLAEARALAADPGRLTGIALDWLISHLACADEPAHPLNALQRDRYAGLRPLFPGVRRSLANSSGIFLGPAYHHEMVRPGAALYGINPLPGQINPMRQVVQLKAKILQVRSVDSGESVGYGASWSAAGRRRIATIATGYADGFLRSASRNSAVSPEGTSIPIVGRVSMDLITLDVTDAPELDAGGWVELVGPRRPADEVAEAGGTIGYELLTRLGPRFARIYHDPA